MSVPTPFTSGAAGPQESAGALQALLLPAMARVATTAVFTGFVWELSVGLGNSWEFLSNCIPSGWREAKDNSLSPGPKRGQCRKSGEVAPESGTPARGQSLKVSPEAETAVPMTQKEAPQNFTVLKGHMLSQGNMGTLS